MYDYELAWGRWHRSKDRKGGSHPFASYMLNKKWTLEEEFNNHMLRFQQVTVESVLFISVNNIFIFQAGLTINEVLFKEEEEVDKMEPLLMEHFSLPIGMWFVGIVISLLCFLAEIIHHRKQVSSHPVGDFSEVKTPGRNDPQEVEGRETLRGSRDRPSPGAVGSRQSSCYPPAGTQQH